jgi:RimJ/RimL family protein N-acetyltransferase
VSDTLKVSDTLSGFDAQPTLRGTLLELRPLCREDFDAVYDAASDPLIWEQHPEPDRYKPDVFRDYFDEQLGSGGALVVVDRASGAVVGLSRYHDYDEERSEVEIGWTFLVRSHWGGTHNRELKSLMLAHAFRFVRTVVFLVGPENVRSQRAVEKIGALRAGSRADAYGRESFVYRIDSSTAVRGRGT